MIDTDSCPCSGRTLGRLLRPAIMMTLTRGQAHGYQIVQDLCLMRMFADQEPDHAGVYRMLRSMEEEGLLTAQWDLAESGPARRLFALTEDGRACLHRWRETLASYRDAIDEILGMLAKAD